MRLGPRTQEKVREIVRACERYGNNSMVVLSGVAGTGKSLMALAAAQRYAGHPLFVSEIQFHQSYTYDDFVEGLRPTPEGGFAPRDGIFTRVNRQALRDPDNRYVLLIEEFSRANVTAVLGELMTYVEHRDRYFETPVTNRRMRVADNLALLGTMNPRDRSAKEVDEALIRRLRLVDCPPDTAQLREMLDGELAGGLIDELAQMFEEIEARHPETFESLMPFGHGMFAGVSSRDDLRDLWHHRIKHLLFRPASPEHRLAEDIEELYPETGAEAQRPRSQHEGSSEEAAAAVEPEAIERREESSGETERGSDADSSEMTTSDEPAGGEAPEAESAAQED